MDTNYYPSPGNANRVYPVPGIGPRPILTDGNTAVPEAPQDGTQYGRQSGAWTPVLAPLGEAPADGFLYGRNNAAWQRMPDPAVQDAPADGVSYARKNNTWVNIDTTYATDLDLVNGLALKPDEAPADGKQYARKDAGWAEVTATGGGDGGGIPEAPVDGTPYARQDGDWVPTSSGGGTSPSGLFQYQGDPSSGDPGQGCIATDTGAPATATTLMVSKTTQDGKNAEGFEAAIVAGNNIFVWERRNSANWASFNTTGPGVDYGTYYEFPVTPAQTQGTEPTNWQEANVSFTFGTSGGGGSAGIPEAPADGKQYLRTNAAWVDADATFATDAALALKANTASPTFTGTVSGITKAMVGLASVDNTSDLNKPVSSATQTALNAKLADAPNDGKPYARQNANWAEITGSGSGIPDAPADGTPYARQDNAWTAATAGGASLKKTSRLTPGSSLWAPMAGTTYIVIEGCGGGGGGAGAAQASTGQGSAGGGGGAARWARKLISPAPGNSSYTVGAGGTAGGYGSGGGTGGNTSFGSLLWSGATGGSNGASVASGKSGTGGPGATSDMPNFDITIGAASAADGVVFSSTAAIGGTGAGSYFGSGGPQSAAFTSGAKVGLTAFAPGAGGAGGACCAGGGGASGGAGGPGVLIIYEFG